MSEAVREKKLPGFRKYKPYPAYKDSGVEWLGEVPEHWDCFKLKRVTSLAYGDSFNAQEHLNGEFNAYGSNGIIGKSYLFNVNGPSIIIGRKGSFGKINYSEESCFTIDTTFYIDNKLTKANIRWLYYCLQILNLDHFSKDSAVPGLSREEIYDKDIPYCDVSEQKIIANFLDRETAKIDALIAKQERLIELLQEKRTALITRAVTKGLDPDVPMKDSGVEWLGEIPAHWKVKPLKAVAFVNPETLAEDTDPDYEFDYIEITDVNFDGSISGKEFMYFNNAPSRAKRKVIQGDIIISTVRTYLKAIALIKESNTRELIVSTGFAVLRNKDKGELENEFLWRLVQSSIFVEKVVSYSEGVSYPAITPYVLGTLPIWFPPPTEQKEIVLFLNRKIGKIDYLTSKVHKSIELLKEHRTALISAAVTGKIDVRREVP